MEIFELCMFDSTGAKVFEIARRKDLTANQKGLLILQLDDRYEGYNSDKWGKLLAVTGANVRKCEFWRNIHRSGDE
jgi:hypothetical protein